MASKFLPCSCSFTFSFCRLKELKYPQVRSQTFSHDENIVDANMGALRVRIAEVEKKERSKKYLCKINNGWYYKSAVYDHKYKRNEMIRECFELMRAAASALSLVFLAGIKAHQANSWC